jgi:hypothetical protein
MIDKIMMKCGHVANAKHNGKPCCVLCCGIRDGWDQISENPDLTGRHAKCATCGQVKHSIENLAFFEYRPDQEFDLFYCGCRGWG